MTNSINHQHNRIYYWAINIEIPDRENIDIIIRHYQQTFTKTIQSNSTTSEQREFIQNNLHIAKTKEEVYNLFLEADAKNDSKCVVIAFNATLSQQEYNKLGVLSFKYLSWSKKVWNGIKRATDSQFFNDLIWPLIKCLLEMLLKGNCEMIKAFLGINI